MYLALVIIYNCTYVTVIALNCNYSGARVFACLYMYTGTYSTTIAVRDVRTQESFLKCAIARPPTRHDAWKVLGRFGSECDDEQQANHPVLESAAGESRRPFARERYKRSAGTRKQLDNHRRRKRGILTRVHHNTVFPLRRFRRIYFRGMVCLFFYSFIRCERRSCQKLGLSAATSHSRTSRTNSFDKYDLPVYRPYPSRPPPPRERAAVKRAGSFFPFLFFISYSRNTIFHQFKTYTCRFRVCTLRVLVCSNKLHVIIYRSRNEARRRLRRIGHSLDK